uniref:Agenet domain-containing family protein n=1 Tax=Populus tomentosa TaxID=118781 RepID=A0A1L6K4T7_POPTO|nr:agenet domain-containing family protein [Populus tomentosa]
MVERLVIWSPAEMALVGYVSWEEVNVSSDKGRREVKYYLKKNDGGIDLAIIGKEKSLRHMSYYFAISIRSNFYSMTPPVKLKSRREVIDWLNSIVSVQFVFASLAARSLFEPCDFILFFCEDDIQSQKLGHYYSEFLWLGSPWTCRKRRKHYESFCRNGVKISVHDFVYVLAEESKRLVAYLEDLYEDSKGNKMVMVRWFHKIDEVGIVLPHNFNDREIFFSLCLQDLSIKCIDGLAIVLSPQHFKKFLNEAVHTRFHPFVCYKQFDNEEVTPFDITQVEGYWSQEIIRYLTIPPSNYLANSQHPFSGLRGEGNDNDASRMRPKKMLRQSKDNDEVMQNPPQSLNVSSEVEVLSQDSGIRGCWFRASIIKKHKDKVKVRYQDISDAANEAQKLEEWVLVSRVAAPDQLAIRISGRTVVRPTPQFNKGQMASVADAGTAVDAWWNDAWWEGIVVHKETEDRIHVFFPGEKKESVFCCSDLRLSLEWLGNAWKHIKERPDILSHLSSCLERKQVTFISDESKLAQVAIPGSRQSGKANPECGDYPLESRLDMRKELKAPPDLSKDNLLAQLRWSSIKKRRRGSGSSGHKMHHNNNGGLRLSEVVGSNAGERFLIPTSLKVDHENCKYMGDSLFTCAVVQPLTGLVMSR